MRLHVVVRGRVQGVGFRWFVREAARRRNVAGWVKNLPDGGVEVAAFGTDDNVAALLSDLRKGPPGAVVNAIDEVQESEVADLERPFSIIR